MCISCVLLTRMTIICSWSERNSTILKQRLHGLHSCTCKPLQDVFFDDKSLTVSAISLSLSLEMAENGLLAEGIEYLFPPVPFQRFQVITGQDVQAGYLQGACGLHRTTNLSTCEPHGGVVSLKANKPHVSSFSLFLIWSILMLNPDTLQTLHQAA